MDKVNCPFCSRDITYKGFHKHIFSNIHKDEMELFILKKKASLIKYVEGNDYKLLPFIIPNVKKPTTTLKFCYGCKSAYLSKIYNKEHSCNHLKEHLDSLKQILSKQSPEAPVIRPVEEDTSKLKCQIESLKKTLNAANAIVDKSEDVSQAMIELLQRLQENHKNIFMEQMVQLRSSRMEVFSEMCESLDIEEYEIPKVTELSESEIDPGTKGPP